MKRVMLLSVILLISFGAVVWATGEFWRPVHGQGALSNADIAGSYAFNLFGPTGEMTQLVIPGTVNVADPFTSTPPGSPTCPSPPNQFPCDQVNLVGPTQISIPTAPQQSIAGQFVADGAGNITSGSGFVFKQSLQTTDGMHYTVVDKSCNFTLTGTYSITSGTSTLTVNPVGSCITPGLSAVLTVLPGNVERKNGVEFGVMYLTAPIANAGTFSSFLNGSFFKQ